MRFFRLLILVMLFSCIQEKPKSDYLGIVNIEITGKKEAIQYFEKGLLLLHSFEYDDAREEFIKARDIDKDLAMAYWGEAMTYNHSLWSEQDFEKGRGILDVLDNQGINSKITDLEKDFISAANILYKSKLNKKDRDKEYSKFMATLYEKYPNNHEIAAFYALSLLGASEDGRDEMLYGKGAKIAQGIIEENPNHPGALHYLIHSYDDPGHAHLALNAADAYAKVAPDASHALHMPSHIYVAQGMWDEVISSNINSYQASLNRKNRKNLGEDERGYHAYHWLEYGYLQKGNIDEAKKMVFEMERFMKTEPSKRARVHMVYLKGTYLVETENWDSKIAGIEVNITDLNINIRSQYQFLEGMKAYDREDAKVLDSVIQAMEKDYKRENYILENEGAKFCSAVTRQQATKSDMVQADIRKNQLLALRYNLENDVKLAEEHFLKSIALNESISFTYGPPQIQKPTHELFADWLVIKGRQIEAEAYYKQALQYAPKRKLALDGLSGINMI